MHRRPFASIAVVLPALVCVSAKAHARDIDSIPADLVVPKTTHESPAAGRRVKQFNRKYAGTGVYHTLYLPVDWQPGKRFPVIVEYAGNKYKTSAGTVEGSSLGYGISAGKGVIWVCMPYVNEMEKKNEVTWWGDPSATVAYCKHTVDRICREFGGDPDNLFIAGFSRGAIACNYIGLHDDEIAALWRGFICHSHYDGVRKWSWAGSDRKSAAARLARLGNRPQFISHENTVKATRDYLGEVCPQGKLHVRAAARRQAYRHVGAARYPRTAAVA